MSIRNLDFLFDPASVAVIGASSRPGSVGATVWRNVVGGGYAGRIDAVNPRLKEIDGHPVHADLAALPAAPDLAIVCTPAATVPGLIAELGGIGTRAAIVVSAGLSGEQRQAMLDAARPKLLRILGPNCIGLLAPPIGLNASFAHTGALPGEIAFISQSGALVTAMLDWARASGIGFSHFVSLGDSLDIGSGIRLRTATLNHPGGATGYRLEFGGRSACYVTDTEHREGELDAAILGLIADADLVIYDATYTDDEFARFRGWGHSTWQEGIRLCEAAGAHRLVAFHHDPEHDDETLDRIAADMEKQRSGSLVAREGLVIDL